MLGWHVSIVAQVVTLPPHAAIGQKSMVATVNPDATEAGRRAFDEGGNAIDAAVAAALMLGVVDSHNSGLGGGCLALIRRSDGQIVAIDGREMAPAAATRDMYLRDGQAVPKLSREGSLAAGVPGALAAYDAAVRDHGKLDLARMLRWAAERADEGYRVSPAHAGAIRSTVRKGLDDFPGLRQIILRPDGQPFVQGGILRNPDLARSYRKMAEQGLDWFYRGEFAQLVGDWMEAHGGIMTNRDFANYKVRHRQPIRTTYRGL